MKLASYRLPGDPQVRFGALVEGDALLELARAQELLGRPADAAFADALGFLDGGIPARERARELLEAGAQLAEARRPVAEVELLAPVPRPRSLRDFMAFEDHIVHCIRAVGLGPLAPLDAWVERRLGRRFTLANLANREFHRRPLYYKGNRFSVAGPGSVCPWPLGTRQLDWELELGVYLCGRGKNVPGSRAHELIGGYTLYDDLSARDVQLAEQRGRLGPAKGKDFDGGNVMGPWLVTPEEVPDPYRLELCARVDGEEVSRGNTRDMRWSFEEMIEAVSRDETLYPGEFLGSGTCSGPRGHGCGLEQGRYLRPGAEVELEGDGLGVLRHRVGVR